ncbi:MAG: hypothetical protein J7L17_00655 [Thaumarchaeota archaeon]|nr:hypothetical protein [Nitrososphaerota archaeon]
MPIRPILGYDIAMGYVSGVAALLVSYYAFRSYSATRRKSLLLFQLGFALAGAGLLLDSSFLLAALITRSASLIALGYSGYFILTASSYCLIIGSYTVDRAESLEASPIALFPLLAFGAFSEGVLSALAAAIAIQLGVNFSYKRSADSFLAFLAFLLIFFSHLSFTLQSLRFPGFLIAGHVLRFLGFTSLLILLARMVRAS